MQWWWWCGGVWGRVLGVGGVWGRVLGVGVRGVRLGAMMVVVVAWCLRACPRCRVSGGSAQCSAWWWWWWHGAWGRVLGVGGVWGVSSVYGFGGFGSAQGLMVVAVIGEGGGCRLAR